MRTEEKKNSVVTTTQPKCNRSHLVNGIFGNDNAKCVNVRLPLESRCNKAHEQCSCEYYICDFLPKMSWNNE